LIDEKEYMSYEQLSELYLKGWDLLNHSYSHKENFEEIILFLNERSDELEVINYSQLFI